jgi:Caspase domain
MNLQPDNSQPGLLANPAWQPGTPGTFAIVIGASHYRHLAGGQDPAPETYSLGQLAVSALTAFEWYRWLKSTYTYSDAPLARCWLLLSPTDAERDFEPELAASTAEASFDNCKRALGYWWQQMRDLPAAAAAKSRAFFFFSGHGIEIYQDKQILLPADYLAPPARSWNDAMSTENLKRALASLDVPEQFFFLDACRNGNADLRRKVINGSSILNEDQSDRVNPDVIAPLFFATSSGQQAFQQPDPDKGLSLFGSALLDGLNGKPDIALVQQDPDFVVTLYALQRFVKRRVQELLAKAGENVRQPVQMSGVVDDATITYLKAYAVRAARGAAPGGFAREYEDGFESTGILGPVARGGEAPVENALLVKMIPSLDLIQKFEQGDFDAGHDIFGSESITGLWQPQNVRVYAFGGKQWLPPSPYRFGEIARTADTSSYRLELEFLVDDPVGYWLELLCQEKTWGCVLPAIGAPGVRYLLEFDVTARQPRELTRLEAGLALSNNGVLGDAARLWQKYRNSDLGATIQVLDASDLRELVRGKVDNPLAALTAAIVLMRGKRSDLLKEWLQNLAHLFPNLPDGAVLWAEHLAREGKTGEALDALAPLAGSPLPFTSEAFSYAARLTRVLMRGKAPVQLPRYDERLDQALPYLRPGGLFTVYTEIDSRATRVVLGTAGR